MSCYSVLFCERSVVRHQNMDVRVLGQPLSHPFLSLKNSNGDIEQELHGTWSAKYANKQRRLEMLIEFANASKKAGTPLSSTFAATLTRFFPDRVPINRMCILNGQRQYQLSEREDTLIEGEAEDIHITWDRLIKSSEEIDKLELPYNRYAFGEDINCQKTMKALLLKSGLIKDHDISLQLGSAGWDEPLNSALMQ